MARQWREEITRLPIVLLAAAVLGRVRQLCVPVAVALTLQAFAAAALLTLRVIPVAALSRGRWQKMVAKWSSFRSRFFWEESRSFD